MKHSVIAAARRTVMAASAELNYIKVAHILAAFNIGSKPKRGGLSNEEGAQISSMNAKKLAKILPKLGYEVEDLLSSDGYLTASNSLITLTLNVDVFKKDDAYVTGTKK